MKRLEDSVRETEGEVERKVPVKKVNWSYRPYRVHILDEPLLQPKKRLDTPYSLPRFIHRCQIDN